MKKRTPPKTADATPDEAQTARPLDALLVVAERVRLFAGTWDVSLTPLEAAARQAREATSTFGPFEGFTVAAAGLTVAAQTLLHIAQKRRRHETFGATTYEGATKTARELIELSTRVLLEHL